MQPLELRDMTSFASRSISALMEIVSILDQDFDKRAGVDVYFEAARAVRAVFDNVAWSDGTLDIRECEMLDALLNCHPKLAASYEQAVNVEPLTVGLEKIPFLIDLASDYDSRNGTFMAHMTINALEMIGFGVVTVNGAVDPKEIETFRKHISAMREYRASHL